MRHHQPQSPIFCFEKHPALHWHRLWCREEGVAMQVTCLCLFVCLLDCRSARHRNYQREKTQRDTKHFFEKIPKAKHSILYSTYILTLHVYGKFPGLLRHGILIWKIALPGQNRLPGNVCVIIKSDYPVHPVKGQSTWQCHPRKEEGLLGGLGDGRNPGWPFKDFSSLLTLILSFCLFSVSIISWCFLSLLPLLFFCRTCHRPLF